MLTGRWRGSALGSGTDTARAFMDWKAGVLSDAEFNEMEEAGARSAGTCMTMGTASTMTSLAEVLGMTLSGASSSPHLTAGIVTWRWTAGGARWRW
jgi:dihydroxy-acid dehydratase